MNRDFLIKTIKFLLFVIIVGTPLFYIKQTVFPFIISKTAFFQSLVEIIFFLWLALAICDKKYRPRRTPALIGLAAFLAVLVFTAVLGMDPWRSFWSIYERAFGVVTFLHLGALVLVLSALYSEIPWRKLFYSSIVTATVVNIVAFLQLWNPNLLVNEGEGARPGSTFDNPSFLAGYALFHIFLALYLFFALRKVDDARAERRQKPNAVWAAVFLIATIILGIATVFITQTRGAVLALAAGVFVLLLLFALRPPAGVAIPAFFKSKRVYGAAILLILLAGALFWFTRGNSFWAKIPGVARFQNLTLGSNDILPRLIALNAAWRGFLDKPILGWGWDNFNVVFNKYYDPRALEQDYQETRFDKPHNFFMEYLVSGGVLLLLAFIFMLGALLYEARRHGGKIFYQIFLAAIAAYIVQNLFLFDTLGPALIFFVFFGFIDGTYGEKIKKESGKVVPGQLPQQYPNQTPPKVNIFAVASGIAAALVLVYQLNILTVKASYYEWRAFNNFFGGYQKESVEDFKMTMSVWSPYRWNFGRDFAANVIMAYFYNQGAVSDNEALLALAAMEKARDEHPLDAYNHYALVDMYNEVSDIDPQKFLPLAEKEAQVALELSPNRQEVYFSLAKTKHMEGNDKAALELAKHALDLDPKVPDAHFYYGLLLFSGGDFANGYKEVKETIALGRKWKNFYEPRTVAGFFGDFDSPNHLDEAIDLYKTALSMQPDDLETQMKLGIAYYFKGDFVNARDYLSEAAKGFDFRKSPAFSELKPILDRLGVSY
jgi:O-antigen ligase/tetratricopeptide (TPR) repeat protein